jgi:hypothetical protein
MGQAGNVISFTSGGFAFNEDGFASNIAVFGIASMMSDRQYVMLEINGQRVIDTKDNDYGFGGTYGYFLSNYFTVTGSMSGVRFEDKSDSTTTGYGTVAAGLTLFPWGKLLQADSSEKIGFTAAIEYTPGTEQLYIGLMVTTLIGK